jgi:type I restriction enzyme S subunit
LAGWRHLRLDDLLTLSTDEVRSSDSESYQVAGVYSFGRGMFKRTTIEGSRTSYRTLHRLHAGQLVMSRLKAWEGAITIVPNEFDGWFLSPEFPTFDLNVNQVDPGYFGALVTSEQFWSRLRGASRGIGARRERVHAARLLEQVIDLPPLSTQRSVASILSRLGTSATYRSSAVERVEVLVAAGLHEVFASLS